jgi:hypothetical protein
MELAALNQGVDGGLADPEAISDLPDAEQIAQSPFDHAEQGWSKPRSGDFSLGDKGGTNGADFSLAVAIRAGLKVAGTVGFTPKDRRSISARK